MQLEVEGRLQLWVATAYPVWQEVDIKAPDVMQQATARVDACVEVLLEQSVSQGFPAEALPSGRKSACQLRCSDDLCCLLFHTPLTWSPHGYSTHRGS